MRILLTAALLTGTALIASSVSARAADLDHYYVAPEPVPHVRVLPPPCGKYRPCVRPYGVYRFEGPYRRFGYYRPWGYGPYREPRLPHPPIDDDYDRFGYDWPRRPRDRYGFDRPDIQPYERPGFHRLDHYGDDERRRDGERYEPGLRPNYGYGHPYDRG